MASSYVQSVTPLYERALRIQEEVLAAAKEAQQVEAAWRGSRELQQEERSRRRRAESPVTRSPERLPLPARPAEAWGASPARRGRTTSPASARRHSPRREAEEEQEELRREVQRPPQPRVASRLAVVDAVELMLEQATDGVRAPGAQLSTSLHLLEVALRRAHACVEFMELAGERGSAQGTLLRRANRRLETLRKRAAERRAKLAAARASRKQSGNAQINLSGDGTRPMVHDLKETSNGLCYRPQSAEEIREAALYRVVRGPAWPETWGRGDGMLGDEDEDDELDAGGVHARVAPGCWQDVLDDCEEQAEEEELELERVVEDKWERLSRSTSSARQRAERPLSPHSESVRRRRRGDFIGAGQVCGTR